MKNFKGFTKIYVKPVNFTCNAACVYCYNHERAKLESVSSHDNIEIIDTELFKYIISSISPFIAEEFTVVYHGGEPLLAGRDFFIKANNICRQNLPRGTKLAQCVQTNATMVDEAWAWLFKGLQIWAATSIDGPKEFNKARVYMDGSPMYDDALKGYNLLREIVGYAGLLVVINKYNWNKAKDIFNWILDNNIRSLDLLACSSVKNNNVENLSITADQAFQFYKELFDLWREKDEAIRIRTFMDALKILKGQEPGTCSWKPNGCGRYLSFDNKGNAYHCGRWDVYPETSLGNIIKDGIVKIVDEKINGKIQQDILKGEKVLCGNCKWFLACGTGCPFLKYSINKDFTKQFPFCSTRKRLFQYIQKALV